MQKKQTGVKVIGLISVLFFFTLLTGCGSKQVASTDIPIPLPPASNQVGSFNDIKMPVEMKFEQTGIAISNENFAGGVFHYKGNVDVASLKDFINASMRNNKWRADADHINAKTTILAYSKPGKTCMIIIKDELLTTTVELMVTHNLTAGRSLDPFGQPMN